METTTYIGKAGLHCWLEVTVISNENLYFYIAAIIRNAFSFIGLTVSVVASVELDKKFNPNVITSHLE